MCPRSSGGTGSLDGKTEVIEIPVDSVTQRITFAFSTASRDSKLKLTQPSGGTITENTASTEIAELNCGKIVTVSTPEAGSWSAEVSGSGRFWLEAEAQSDIHFINAEFVKEGGRPGHEGLFRIQGQPLTGKPAMLQVSLSAQETKTAEFHLVSERGDAIHEVKLHALNTDREFLELAGKVELPAAPFRVAVTGLDSHGRTYQRFYSSLFHVESVEVAASLDSDELSVGDAKKAAFTVRNIGAARKFKMTVTDAHQFVSSVEPKELNLGVDESGKVLVELRVPTSATAGIGDDLVVVAASIVGPPTTNSCVVHLSVLKTKD
jgi:von Willebrand factor A domain-containing protein 7